MEALADLHILGIPLPVVVLAVGLSTVVLLIGLLVGTGHSSKTKKRLKVLEQRFATESLGVGAGTPRVSAQPVSLDLQKAEDGSTKLDRMIKRLMPRRHLLRQRVEQAGWKIDLGRLLLMTLGGGSALGAALSLLLPISAVACLILGPALVSIVVQVMIAVAIGKRRDSFTAEFPDALDLMVRSLRAGLPLSATFKTITIEFNGPIAEEFQRLDDRIKVGTAPIQALQEAAERIGTAEFRFLTVAIAIQQETGGNLGETLSNLSRILRGRRTLALKVKAMSSEAKTSAYIIGSLPIAMFFLMRSLNAEYVSVLTDDPTGQMLLGVAILSLVSGVFVMTRMAKVKP